MFPRLTIKVLEESKHFLVKPENCFDWSSWENAEEAISEIDALILAIKSGNRPKKLDLEVLFAPTGPIQEVSLSSGWGNEFLRLASKFDRAIALY
jgi:hypothetical protein